MTVSTPAVTDLVQKAVGELRNGTAGDAARANVYARLAAAQQQKVANIIAYLNSDLPSWAAEDEAVVRRYLGLSAPADDSRDTDEEF